MEKILNTKSKTFIKKVKNAPKIPGCYMYKDSKNEVIYVGKAKNIRNRVKSYFNNYSKLDTKTQIMIETAKYIDYFSVDTEFDALILESNLIKKYRPKYNILLRDDKSYVYVRFEKIRKKNQPPPTNYSVYQDFPRITMVREKKDDGAEYFGPYPDAHPVKRVLYRLRRIFPYRNDNYLVYQKSEDPKDIYTSNKKPSLYYHIGLSKGTEAGLETKKEYINRFNKIKRFFKGERNQLIRELESELKNAVKSLQFEKAAELRDKINDINYVTRDIKISSDIDDVMVSNILRRERENAIASLVDQLNFPSDKLMVNPNFRIECYDISNIQGKNAVGSMVVMVNGQVKPNLYRRFKIQMKNEPNDFAMLQEVLTRRFKYFIAKNIHELQIPKDLKNKAKNWKEDQSFKEIPDLIIIDGGKGQLASAYKILYNFNLHNTIPIVGLAKKMEEIFKLTDQFKDEFNQVEDSSQFTKIILKRRSESLYLVQRIRDEAHRFAITYHRNLRSRKLVEVK